MADLIGRRLGQYEITGLLGEGGMSTVYRARQVSIQRDVAIKVIEAKVTRDDDFLKRFDREAQLIASLNHAHIAKVFDYGRNENLVYLVMELLRGGSLADVVYKGALRLDIVSRILDQIASALDYAHHKGIVHRDLKPQNLMLDEAKNILLTDFGLAKLVNETTAMTQTGLTVGTPAYMSPEQWRDPSVDGRSDVYSLGVVVFQMLTGKLPFNGETPYRMMYMHMYEAPPSLNDFMPNLPGNLDLVVQQALVKDPNLRFNRAGELARAFKGALAGSPAPSPKPMPLPTMSLASAGPGVTTVTPEPGRVRVDERGISQVYVPAGGFLMGSNAEPGARDDEQPIHEVQIGSGFWIDQYSVTNEAYKAFIEDGGYGKRQYWSNSGWQWVTANSIVSPGTYTGFAEPQQPRVGVSWYEADAYARWRGGRLPTEAQWEYAARGPQSLIYPWGNAYLDKRANVRGTRTRPVDAFPDGKSWVGAYDMSGNAWEWVSDWYDEDYYAQSVDLDPSGPSSGKTHVLRGGSWRHDQFAARTAARRHDGPSSRDDYIGFRVVSSAIRLIGTGQLRPIGTGQLPPVGNGILPSIK